MIVSAALCPSSPLLARDLTGQAEVLAELRDACAVAVTRLLAARPDVVAVVGQADATATWDPGSRLDLSGYAPALAPSHLRVPVHAAGPPRRRDPRWPLPLSLGIGALLLDEAGYPGPRLPHAVAAAAAPDECARLGRTLAGPAAPPGPASPAGRALRLAMLVMGDGTARRSLSAPGYLDERAEPFDAEVERALRDGDLAALTALDQALAADLMATNRAPLQVLAAALTESAARRQRVEGSGTRPPRADILYSAAPFGVAYLVATLTSPAYPA